MSSIARGTPSGSRCNGLTIDPGIVRAVPCAARPSASFAKRLVALQLTQLGLQPSKLNVEGSSPFTRCLIIRHDAL